MCDVHSPACFLVNRQLPNIDAWYPAFDVTHGEKLYLLPDSACASGRLRCPAAADTKPRQCRAFQKGFTTASTTIATRNSAGTSL